MWIARTIPMIIYLEKQVNFTKIFCCRLILASFTSLATGTSWGTLGTVGLA